ncbi:MAG: bifunctional 4-hydroxy-2-oxoglutarate aldolase/2-dehydro-3-deoxy-phosphogluconate aldolase [Clostridiales bacterium]|jgi:2-dehydro-3-deoxyphosphogluconate aldolase/(4S)-4-hydroxy-2-oxoglutarate aldolase|nr:bifunctional 4-hydroxy-2-oxoglutarate aldolase/2-dehydro-3-deoxy-phosphogluconate aldolase [Clostridiales bacterium]
MQVNEIIKRYGVVPVVVLNGVEETVPVLNRLRIGGLPIAEITFRTACAKDAVRLAVKTFPDMLIGAGTVITAEQCGEAAEAGAKFIVGPGFSAGVAEACKKRGLPYFPGCVTPSEIMTALSFGLNVLKFFPAQVYGGLKAINALGAAFPNVKFIPTGGVDNSNLAEYLSNPKVYAVGGSFMLKGDVQKTTEEAMEIVKKIRS